MAKNNLQGKVRIQILPGRGIGGVGSQGDKAWMDKAEAQQYAKDGYLKIISHKEEAAPIPSSADDVTEAGDAKSAKKKTEKKDKAKKAKTKPRGLSALFIRNRNEPEEDDQEDQESDGDEDAEGEAGAGDQGEETPGDHAIMQPENKRQ